MLKIILADDHELIRTGLRSMFVKRSDWEIVGEAVDGCEAVAMSAALKPHVIVMDVGMPNLNGLEATRQIMKAQPSTHILILSVHDSERIVHDVLEAGARGYLLKSDAGRDLLSAVEAVSYGRTYFTERVANFVLYGYRNGSFELERQHSLSPREREIIQFLVDGGTAKEIATHLNLSIKTIESHRANLMRKLNVHNLPELVLYAVRNGIVSIEPLHKDVAASA